MHLVSLIAELLIIGLEWTGILRISLCTQIFNYHKVTSWYVRLQLCCTCEASQMEQARLESIIILLRQKYIYCCICGTFHQPTLCEI